MTRHVVLRTWESAADFAAGTFQGTAVDHGLLVYAAGAGVRAYTDPHAFPGSPVTYEWAAWVSPWVTPGFGATELIPSWNATTPDGTWLEVEIRVSIQGSQEATGAPRVSRWYVLGRWAQTDRDIHPTTLPGQRDRFAEVATDVLALRDGATLSSYQLRVTLLRRPGTGTGPTVRMLAVMASAVPRGAPAAVSLPGPGRGRELAVPAHSQQLHRGRYPQWDNGGESWCSPTSTTMLLGSWGTGPTPEDYAWVDPALPDRSVVHAARAVFDHGYAGAGNWAFNVAYAAGFGLRAFVTRLRSLAEAEVFIAAGIPLVATVSFPADGLTGAGYATGGHLLTIIGFDQSGNVVSHDPASHGVPSNEQVRVVYDRAEFERVWLGSAGGVVYVMHPVDVPLPDRPAEPNW